MYFDNSKIGWVSARLIIEQLLQKRAIGISDNYRSLSAFFNHKKWFAALEYTIYFISLVEVNIDVCFWDCKEIIELLSLNK
jgi:hypothetical protein